MGFAAGCNESWFVNLHRYAYEVDRVFQSFSHISGRGVGWGLYVRGPKLQLLDKCFHILDVSNRYYTGVYKSVVRAAKSGFGPRWKIFFGLSPSSRKCGLAKNLYPSRLLNAKKKCPDWGTWFERVNLHQIMTETYENYSGHRNLYRLSPFSSGLRAASSTCG